MRKMKRVEDSRTENTYLIMNKHINSYGRLFGGMLMQWIDEMAGIVAHRHSGTIITTVSGRYSCSYWKGNSCRDNFHGSPD